MSCPAEIELLRFLEAEMDEADRRALEQHLDRCSDCREVLSELGRDEDRTEIGLTAGWPPALAAEAPVRDIGEELAPGEKVGRYEIIHVLGVGGMGVVYAAWDPELDRKVALKLLRSDHAARSASARARLLREAKAMARLSHPGVVAVHDAGTFGTQVYVAMELVTGFTLREWLRGESTRSWREILEVFVAAGRGLAAAHRAGLVHRDFKPTNVLIGDDGQIKVGDFGLALVAGEAPAADGSVSSPPDSSVGERLTQSGAILGTPAYMAPEQYRHEEADPATDQFSFCVALYEALYQRRPFPGDSVESISDSLESAQVDVPRSGPVPRRVRRALRRGLNVERSRRFPSMEALLSHLVPPQRSVRRWVAAAVLLVASGVAAWVATYLTREANRCAGSADRLLGVWDTSTREAVRQALTGAGRRGPQAWEKTSAVLDSYAKRWVHLRDDACHATHTRRVQSEELLDLRMWCMEGRFRRFRALVQVLRGGSPAILDRATKAAYELPSLSECSDTRALLREKRPPGSPAARRRLARQEERLARAEALLHAGRYKAARRAIEKQLKELGAQPALVARALLLLGRCLIFVGDKAKAARILQRASWKGYASKEDAIVTEASARLVYVYGYWLNDAKEALRAAQQAEAGLARLGNPPRLEAYLRFELSSAHVQSARFKDALTAINRGMETARKVEDFDYFWAKAHDAKGVALWGLGRYEEAARELRKSLQIHERLLGRDHPDVAITYNNLGLVMTRMAKAKEALRYLRKSLAIRERIFPPDSPFIANALSNMGGPLRQVGRFEEAVRVNRRALAIRKRKLGPKHPDTALSHNNLGAALAAQGKYAAALAQHRKALAIRTEATPTSSPFRAYSLYHVGANLLALGRPAEALPLTREAWRIIRKSKPKGHVWRGYVLTGLGETLLALGRAAEAQASLGKASKILSQVTKSMRWAKAHFAYARALWDTTRDRKRALGLAQEAETVLAKTPEGRRSLARLRRWRRTLGRANERTR